MMTRAIEIGRSIWLSWDAYRAGAQSMRSKGKSRIRLVLILQVPTVGYRCEYERGRQR